MAHKKGKVTKKKELVIVAPAKTPQIIEVDGEKYIIEREKMIMIDGIEHCDKLVYKKFDEKEYKENLQILVDAISKRTTKKELLSEILKTIDMKTLKRLVKRVKDKKPIKKQKGCLGFKIGDAHVQIVD